MRTFNLLLLLLCCLCAVRNAHAQPEGKTDIRENLGPTINTGRTEILPVVSPDGKTLYFDRKFDSANVGGVDDEDDIYYSTLQRDGTWSVARNIGPPLSTSGSDVLYWISPDGNTALVYNGAVVNGRTLGLSLTHRVNGAWKTPKPLKIQGITNLGQLGYYAFISPDMRRLLLAFASDSTEPENADLYYCPALGTDLIEWGAPVSLGSTINTDRFEGAPFIAADNRTLYFISDGHIGMGATDIYVSRRLGESWLNWSTPVNLGPWINTPFTEASLSITATGDYAYISGMGSYGDVTFGKADIFRVRLPDTMRPRPVEMIEGKLVAKSGGIEGLVRVERISDRKELASTASDNGGNFTLVLPLGESYRLTGWAEGYNETTQTVDLKKPKQTSMKVMLRLTGNGKARPADTASSLFAIPPTGPIRFAFGSDLLSEDARNALSKALVGLKAAEAAGRSIEIDLTGHTDNIGSDEMNRELSLRRAESVRRWLVEQGLDSAGITIAGRGKSQPVASNGTDEGRARNRRVEITVEGVLTVPNAVVTPRREDRK
jgi:outer membrane protein OmpA-like peptidoglycan-associated protein